MTAPARTAPDPIAPVQVRGSMRIDRVDPRSVTPVWDRLARTADHPFATRAWLEPHLRTSSDPARAVLITRADEPMALFVLARRRDGVVDFLGSAMSDRAGVACSPPDAADAFSRLPEIVAMLTGPDEPFVGRSVLETHAAVLPSAWIGTRVASPVIDTDAGSWESYLDGPAARRRRRIVRLADQLLATRGVEVHDAETIHTVPAAFDELARLHDLRFGTAAQSFVGARRTAVCEAVTALSRDGNARVRVLRIDGVAVAAILVMHWAGDDWYYQAGFDPDFADRSVGRALFADTVRQAFSNRRGAFHLLRGDEPYKSYWSTRCDTVVQVAQP